jgi:hypothetical protein
MLVVGVTESKEKQLLRVCESNMNMDIAHMLY